MENSDKNLLLLNNFKTFLETGTLPASLQDGFFLMLFQSQGNLSDAVSPNLYYWREWPEQIFEPEEVEPEPPLSSVSDFSALFAETALGQLFNNHQPLLAKPSDLAHSLSLHTEEHIAIPISIHTGPLGFVLIPKKIAYHLSKELNLAAIFRSIANNAFQDYLNDALSLQKLQQIATAEMFVRTFTNLCVSWLHPCAFELLKNDQILEKGISSQLGIPAPHPVTLTWVFGGDRFCLRLDLPVFQCFTNGEHIPTNRLPTNALEKQINDYFGRYGGFWQLVHKQTDARTIKQALFDQIREMFFGTSPPLLPIQAVGQNISPSLPRFGLYKLEGLWEMYAMGKRVNVDFSAAKLGITAIYLLFHEKSHVLTPVEMYRKLDNWRVTKKRKHEPGAAMDKDLKIDELYRDLIQNRNALASIKDLPTLEKINYWHVRLSILEALLFLSSRRSYIREIVFVKSKIESLSLLTDQNFANQYKGVFLNQADKADKNNIDTIVKGIEKAIDLFKPSYPELYRYLDETIILRNKDGEAHGYKPFAFVSTLGSDPAFRGIQWVTILEDE